MTFSKDLKTIESGTRLEPGSLGKSDKTEFGTKNETDLQYTR